MTKTTKSRSKRVTEDMQSCTHSIDDMRGQTSGFSVAVFIDISFYPFIPFNLARSIKITSEKKSMNN
jgi:hypothetical protein